MLGWWLLFGVLCAVTAAFFFWPLRDGLSVAHVLVLVSPRIRRFVTHRLGVGMVLYVSLHTKQGKRKGDARQQETLPMMSPDKPATWTLDGRITYQYDQLIPQAVMETLKQDPGVYVAIETKRHTHRTVRQWWQRKLRSELRPRVTIKS